MFKMQFNGKKETMQKWKIMLDFRLFAVKSMKFSLTRFSKIQPLYLHCGYCSNSPNMELQSLKMLQAIQNHSCIHVAMFSESHYLHSFHITS